VSGFFQRALGVDRGSCFLVRPPGVYRVDSDTRLLIDVVRNGGYAAGRRVLDVGTGTGALALAATQAGAASVTAVDVSLRSVAAAWLNSRLHRVACTGGICVRRSRASSLISFGQPALCPCGHRCPVAASD
jgi:methylase of polypeptide subunit release factors